MDWPHAPLHRFGDSGNYFITAGTYLRRHLFATTNALDELQQQLFDQARKHDCWLQAWSLFSNHYHLVIATDDGARVKQMLTRFHTTSAIALNARDGAKGRTVWFQFRDTQLTHQSSWLARLRYTHENAVHHDLVGDAINYRWCSASWFADTAPRAFVQTVRGVKIDRVNVFDEYVPK